jgi:hypothetical protein
MKFLGMFQPHEQQMELLNKVSYLESELEQRDMDVAKLSADNLMQAEALNKFEFQKQSQPDKDLVGEVTMLRSLLREKDEQIQNVMKELDISLKISNAVISNMLDDNIFYEHYIELLEIIIDEGKL